MTAPGPGGTAAVRLGVALPIFAESPARVLRAAEQAESAGLDGVFSYDHLWPLGEPARPAHSLFPLLGALAARTRRVALGSLVARVGIAPTDKVLAMFLAVARLSAGRLIAGIGTGDAKNAPENAAYGVEFAPAQARREMVEALAEELVAAEVATWIGGGAPETNAIARRLGCPLNLWAATPERVAAAARLGAVTWAGNLPRDELAAARLVGELAEAGASWVIVHWPGGARPLLAAAQAAGIVRARA